MYIDIIAVDDELLVPDLKRQFTTSETIVPVCHLNAEPSVFLLWLGIKWWRYGLDAFLLKIEFIIDSNDTTNYWNGRLLVRISNIIVLGFLFHLFSQFLDSAILHSLTCLEQVSSHLLKFASFLLFLVFNFVLVKFKMWWNWILWVQTLTFQLLEHASGIALLWMHTLILFHQGIRSQGVQLLRVCRIKVIHSFSDYLLLEHVLFRLLNSEVLQSTVNNAFKLLWRYSFFLILCRSYCYLYWFVDF